MIQLFDIASKANMISIDQRVNLIRILLPLYKYNKLHFKNLAK